MPPSFRVYSPDWSLVFHNNKRKEGSDTERKMLEAHLMRFISQAQVCRNYFSRWSIKDDDGAVVKEGKKLAGQVNIFWVHFFRSLDLRYSCCKKNQVHLRNPWQILFSFSSFTLDFWKRTTVRLLKSLGWFGRNDSNRGSCYPEVYFR